MVEITEFEGKKPSYWEEMNKKGKQDAQIQAELDAIFQEHASQTEETIFQKKPHDDIFTEAYTDLLNEQIADALTDCDLTRTERDHRIEATYTRIREFLYLKIQKKALCTIEFPAYDFYRFTQFLSAVIDETEILIEENGIRVKGISFTFYRLKLFFLRTPLIYRNIYSFTVFRSHKPT
jgi:ribulose 1,5-bisphosphate carboxylase large subunit-like protein